MSDPGLNNIKVDVETRYIEEQSNPEQNYYVFAYTITIQNQGRQAARKRIPSHQRWSHKFAFKKAS